MRLASAVTALFLVSLAVCGATRLSVFREDFNGEPGRTYVVLHGDEGSAGLPGLPGGLEWFFQQVALLRAMQNHMMLNTLPPFPSSMSTASVRDEDTLRRVGCQRVRQAMLEEDQDVWRSAFGGDSDISTVMPALSSGTDNSEGPRCYDVRGDLVACDSDDAVMQDNWMDIQRPIDPAPAMLPYRGNSYGPLTTDAATSTDPEGEVAASAADGAVYRQLRPADIFFGAEDGDDDEEEDSNSRKHSSEDADGDEGNGDGIHSQALQWEEEPAVQEPWRQQQGLQDRPPTGSILLVTTGVLCAALVTLGALVLVVLAVVRRRCTSYGDVDAWLVAPLLSKDGVVAGQPVPVCGIKVAAAEAQRDAVEGIDTTAALLKGQGLAPLR